MTYICVVDNYHNKSCSLIISNKIIRKSRLIISVNPDIAVYVKNRLVSYFILHSFNIENSDYQFFPNCVNIILPYLQSINTDFTVIDPDSLVCCC
jgi:hypothetical protein